MSKYNLDEYLATKTENQVIALIRNNIKRDSKSLEILMKYDGDYRYEDSRKHQAMIKKARSEQEDCSNWIHAAVVNFSKGMWNRMIIAAGASPEGWCYEDLTE